MIKKLLEDSTKKPLSELLSFYKKEGEVIGDDDLSFLPSKIVVYTGFELSGKPHLGTYTSLKRVCSFEKVSDYQIETVLLLADLHSFINQKDIINNKQYLIDFSNKYKHPNTKVLSGFLEDQNKTPGHQQEEGYWSLVYKILNRVPLNRLKRCITLENKLDLSYTPLKSQLLYVVLQVVDIIILGVDISIGGSDQRKIHMLHSDIRTKYLKNENLKKVIYIHHRLFHDSQGVKISKSKQNYSCLEQTIASILDKDNETNYNNEKTYLVENIYGYLE